MFLQLFSPKNLQIKEQFMASANIGGYAEKCSINEFTFVPRATRSAKWQKKEASFPVGINVALRSMEGNSSREMVQRDRER